MSTRGQVSENAGMKRWVKPVAFSVLLGAVVCAAVLFLMSLLLTSGSVPQMAIDPMASVALAAGGFVAGLCCAKIMRHSGLAFGAICGAVLTAILLVLGFALGDGGFGVPALFKVAFLMLSAMLGGVLGVNTKKRRK